MKWIWRLLPLLAAAVLLRTFALAQSAPPTPAPDDTVHLPTVDVIGASPLLGSGVDRSSVPAETNVLRPEDIARGGMPSTTRALEEQIGAVSLDSASGNPYQPTLLYHGFEASPLQGTPQGMSVYVNGVRFNQPFGDTLNWDLIPDNAIDELNIEGSNPVFGLNALGGAINVQLKNGFTYHGGEASLYGGSFATIDGDLQYGKQSGDTAAYVALGERHEGGWRDQQSSDLQNFYGDLGWRGDSAELHAGLTLANSVLNGPGTAPVELIAADPRAQFTGPNRIASRYLQLTLSGNVDVSDTLSLQSVGYFENFLQRVANGNAPNDTACNDGSGLLCDGSGISTTVGNLPIPDFLNGGPYSELDDQTTNTNGYGLSVQATDTAPVFGFTNHLVGGASFDGATTGFAGQSFIGGLTPLTRDFIGPGVVIDEPGINTPVRVVITDAYYGVFAADTLNLTNRLAVTVSGRFNAAAIDLSDRNGGDLTGNHDYVRFNPAVGLTYRAAPWLVGYVGYAEANRAPTPAELSCAGPAESCSLANFFVGDPNLKQVVSRTVEAGIRGDIALADNTRLSYDIGLYRSDLTDDIGFINSPTLNRAYFANIGTTQRQGIDASVRYKTTNWSAFLSYAYTDASYRSGFVESAGSNPMADANGNLTIAAGDQLPGIAAHQLKFGANVHVTPDWTVGFVGLARSGSYLYGDESNANPKLPGYVTLNLTTSYRVTPRVEVFGTVENVTDARYFIDGTFSPTSAVSLAQAPNATNPRSYSIAAPIAGFGGVRVKF